MLGIVMQPGVTALVPVGRCDGQTCPSDWSWTGMGLTRAACQSREKVLRRA
jgi:hypothetical protein